MYRAVLTVFPFGVHGFGTGFFQAIYLYTPEVSEVFNMEICCDSCQPQVYPTAVRAFGMSLCSSVSRVGAMIAPYIAQVSILRDSDNISVYCAVFCVYVSDLPHATL